ncbi:MAG: hypothetical protein AB8H47_29565 [Bacteroidia bacterium]
MFTGSVHELIINLPSILPRTNHIYDQSGFSDYRFAVWIASER